MIRYPIKPQPYVRMTQSTLRTGPKAKPEVKRYMAFKKKCAQYSVTVPMDRPIMVFEFATPNPNHWGLPYCKVPDLDNLIKGLCDAAIIVDSDSYQVDDKMISQEHAMKVCARESSIWVGQMPYGILTDVLLEQGYADASLGIT